MMNAIGRKGWARQGMKIFWGEIAPTEHILQIYEDDKIFIDVLEQFVSSGLNVGDSVVVIATTEHLKALNQRLKTAGLDLFSLTLQDQYIPLNAEEMLSHFMINGWPDENLFYHLLTNLLLRARKRDRQVRAFGEMVAILWGQGHSGATVHLEYLWSRYCQTEEFSVFCAYPKSGFTENANESLLEICSCHSKFVSGPNDDSEGILYREGSQKVAG
ncbi:MAG TPA: MEDS domain-containing protein [Chryseosolibacter sp.]